MRRSRASTATAPTARRANASTLRLLLEQRHDPLLDLEHGLASLVRGRPDREADKRPAASSARRRSAISSAVPVSVVMRTISSVSTAASPSSRCERWPRWVSWYSRRPGREAVEHLAPVDLSRSRTGGGRCSATSGRRRRSGTASSRTRRRAPARGDGRRSPCSSTQIVIDQIVGTARPAAAVTSPSESAKTSQFPIASRTSSTRPSRRRPHRRRECLRAVGGDVDRDRGSTSI